MNMPQDGGPAFPVVVENPPYYIREGMTLRDWFAGMALQAIISKHPAATCDVEEDAEEVFFANGAYAYADAMLLVRLKPFGLGNDLS